MGARQRRRKKRRDRGAMEAAIESRGRRLAAGAGVALGASLLVGNGLAEAATFTVDSLSDPSETGKTTLRDAVASAETPANSGSTIVFATGLSGTVHLGSELPQIRYPTIIQGPGAGQIAISGDSSTRLMYLDGSEGMDVTVAGLSLINGLSQSPPGPRNGAAIYNQNADLTVSDSILSGNTALGSSTHDGYGGAICSCTGSAGSLTVRNSTFSGNAAGGSGGAIYTDNHALTIQGSTFNRHDAYYRGGAISICCTYANSVIDNSTFTDNHATGSSNSGYGGAVFSSYGDYSVTLTGSTLAGNSGNYGGGVFSHGTVPVTMHDTIVASNTAAGMGPDVNRPANSAFRLIADTAGATITETVAGSDITGVDPQLGALADNGGTSQTMLPTDTSPVVNKGSAFGLSSDQRGFCRPIVFTGVPNSSAPGADGSDMGAVELQNGVGAAC